jgi:DNA-binding SARP family transcriptional activator
MMTGYRDDSRAWRSAGADHSLADTAQDRLSPAELRRMEGEQLFQALERLADADDDLEAWRSSSGSARELRQRSTEYLGLAAELETAAQRCRLIEQELRRRITALAAGPSGQAETVGNRGADRRARRTYRFSLVGWLRGFPQRGHALQPPHEEDVGTSSFAERQRLVRIKSSRSLPPPEKPDADVAALMLGPLELDVAGRRVVKWSSLKARAVFQYLLIHHDRPVRRDVLMNLQWPNHTHASARNNLNVALHSLRNALDGPWHEVQPVVYQDGCYVLNPELRWWMDRDEFHAALSQAHLVRISGHPRQALCHYERAVGLYRGRLFEDDSSDDWYLPEQRHLNELYLEALEGLGEIYFDIGDLDSAEYFGQLGLTNDLCCEPIHRLLMRCYSADHKQHLVKRQYRLCVDALRDELDISPDAETDRLFHGLISTSR